MNVLIEEAVESISTINGKVIDNDELLDNLQAVFEIIPVGDLGFEIPIESFFQPFSIKLKVCSTGKVSECAISVKDREEYIRLQQDRDLEEQGDLCEDMRNYFLKFVKFDEFDEKDLVIDEEDEEDEDAEVDEDDENE